MRIFKKATLQFILPIFLIGILFVSCSKNDDTTTYSCIACKTMPDALAENDASIKGVYKGIIIGSTGTISINIQNGSNTITATMVLDGVSVTLTSNVGVVNGQSYVAPFTGTFNGSPISVTFSVGLSGANPTMVSSSIPGHPNAVFKLVKETSTSMIEAFEGTYSVSDGEKGVFNLVLSRAISKFGYIARENGQTETNTGDGKVNTNNELVEDGLVLGKISGDEISGSFKNSDNFTVTISGKRTL